MSEQTRLTFAAAVAGIGEAVSGCINNAIGDMRSAPAGLLAGGSVKLEDIEIPLAEGGRMRIGCIEVSLELAADDE